MKITICDKEHEIACNAYTRFEYKRVFKTGIFEDLAVLQKFSTEQEKIKKEMEGKAEEEINDALNLMVLKNLDDFIDVVEKIAYILILTANPKIGSFEEFLTGIEKINLSDSWIAEVTEFAVNSFCG